MLRIIFFTGLLFIGGFGFAQRHLTRQEALSIADANRVNTDVAQLDLIRQQQLLKSSRNFDNPEIEFEIDPYDPMVVGLLMPLRLPGVYASRRGLQKERIRLSELLLKLNRYDINRLVQNSYNEVQYLSAKTKLLSQQDSLYQGIKTAAERNFRAGQINKLEELFAANEANNVRNEFERTLIDLNAQKKALSFILNVQEDFSVDSFRAMTSDPMLLILFDTTSLSIRPQILQQQVMISQLELKNEKAELLPQVNTGPLFGLEGAHGESAKRQGWRVSLSMPLFFTQNRARINAAKTGVQIAEAQRQKEIQELNREYSLALSQLLKEQKSLQYYTSVANEQAIAITQTALRLFEAGQVNYTETVRNIITAFQTKISYLESIKSFNQAIIELKYLNGSL